MCRESHSSRDPVNKYTTGSTTSDERDDAMRMMMRTTQTKLWIETARLNNWSGFIQGTSTNNLILSYKDVIYKIRNVLQIEVSSKKKHISNAIASFDKMSGRLHPAKFLVEQMSTIKIQNQNLKIFPLNKKLATIKKTGICALFGSIHVDNLFNWFSIDIFLLASSSQ